MRRVEVEIGPDETYRTHFIEGKLCFEAQSVCLCGLSAAAKVWLAGGTERDTQAAFLHEH